MADITGYGYPSRFALNGNDTTTYTTASKYFSDNTAYTNFTGTYHDDSLRFQEHPQVDPTTRPLIVTLAEYDNGIDLKLEYFTEDHTDQAPPYARVTGYTKLVDHRTQNLIESGTEISASSGFTYDIPLPIPAYMNRLPDVPIRYIAGTTSYAERPDVHVNDLADEIYPFGTFYAAMDPGLHPLEDLSGEVKTVSVLNTYYRSTTINNSIIRSSEELEDFINDIVDAGNGTNPVADPATPSDKPFENNPSRPGGGYGNYQGKGDITGKPGLPSSGVLSSGFIAMYNPSTSNLQALGAKLWSDDFIDNFLKLWNDPMEAIITLGLVPFSPTSTGSTNCVIGNYDTQIPIPRVTAQYQSLTCGSVSIEEFWGNALDYGPYTSAEIFLPFVGMKQLDIDDIMGKTVSVDYNIDLLGGEAVAYITVDSRVLYDFRCNMMSSVPISASSYASLYSGILRAASGLAIGAAAGGIGGAAAGGLTSAINIVGSKHSNIERGGELSPNAGALGLLTPYIILHRPVQSLPSNFGHFKGYPSNITRTLGSVSGYTEVNYIHLDGTTATDAEREEIYALLKAGVIL